MSSSSIRRGFCSGCRDCWKISRMIGWWIGCINVLLGFCGCLWSCGGLSFGCGLLSYDGLPKVFYCLLKSVDVVQNWVYAEYTHG